MEYALLVLEAALYAVLLISVHHANLAFIFLEKSVSNAQRDALIAKRMTIA